MPHLEPKLAIMSVIENTKRPKLDYSLTAFAIDSY